MYLYTSYETRKDPPEDPRKETVLSTVSRRRMTASSVRTTRSVLVVEGSNFLRRFLSASCGRDSAARVWMRSFTFSSSNFFVFSVSRSLRLYSSLSLSTFSQTEILSIYFLRLYLAVNQSLSRRRQRHQRERERRNKSFFCLTVTSVKSFSYPIFSQMDMVYIGFQHQPNYSADEKVES